LEIRSKGIGGSIPGAVNLWLLVAEKEENKSSKEEIPQYNSAGLARDGFRG